MFDGDVVGMGFTSYVVLMSESKRNSRNKRRTLVRENTKIYYSIEIVLDAMGLGLSSFCSIELHRDTVFWTPTNFPR
jgi:hypothetical protein